MPRNKMDDLRNHLFEVIEMLKEGEMPIETASAIVDAAKCLVETAKIEVAVLKITSDARLEAPLHPQPSNFLQIPNTIHLK